MVFYVGYLKVPLERFKSNDLSFISPACLLKLKDYNCLAMLSRACLTSRRTCVWCLGTRTHAEEPRVATQVCNPSTGEVETDVVTGFTDQLVYLMWWVPHQWETLPWETKHAWLSSDLQMCLNIEMYLYICKDEHTCKHTHTYTQTITSAVSVAGIHKLQILLCRYTMRNGLTISLSCVNAQTGICKKEVSDRPSLHYDSSTLGF